MLAALERKENVVLNKTTKQPFLEFSAHQKECLLTLYDLIGEDEDDVDEKLVINALYEAFEALYFPPYSNEAVNDTFLEPVIRFWASKLIGNDGSYLSPFLLPVMMAKLQYSKRLRGFHLVFATQERSAVKGAKITIGGFTATIGDGTWFE